jgi:glycosyltransferase involved in cell wall biosynthesis
VAETGVSTQNMTMTGETPQLAVVIPVWRSRFLGAALDSLRAQTDRRFRVYIGDDASPDNVNEVIARHGAGLDLHYHRFADNLGGHDLVGQWERCLALTQGEPWLWLFADDDELESGCVAGFYAGLQRYPGARLFALSTLVIDEHGAEIKALPEPPRRESAKQLLQALLAGGGREVRGADHVFARLLYEESGGFEPMPRALYSDLATWVKFAEWSGGLIRIEGGRLRWRLHGGCTSNFHQIGMRRAYVEAMGRYARFVGKFSADWPPRERRQVRACLARIAKDVVWSTGGPREHREMLRVYRDFAAAGGHVLAWRVTLVRWRGLMRRWPVVAIWCRWRYQRRCQRPGGSQT